MSSLERIGAALRNMVTRGKVAAAALNPKRTLLQLNILQAEIKNRVELLLPFGMSAFPDAGDVLVFQVLGSRDHVVALCADNPALRIADLVKTEFGFRDARGQQVVFRTDRIEVTTPLDAVVTAGGNITLAANTAGKKVRIEGDTVEIVAHSKLRQEVHGYAEELAYAGGTTWTDTTWHTGAAVTPISNPIDPPEHFGP